MEASDILVVDDSRIVLAMVTDILAEEGYRVRQAENGRVALERVAEARPDLIVLDVMMPEMDGYEVCETLRRESDYIPILMITAKGELEDLVRGLDAGADDYIAKPFQAVELVARVKSLLRIGTLQKRLLLQNFELEAKNQQLEALARQLDDLNKELTLLSVTDGLTRAYNHRHFQERLKSEFSRAKRYEEPLACVMLDIDHFKRVNDTWGHPVGDRVLVRIVEILKEGIRSEDLVARYGGEEFVLLLPRTDSEHAAHLAERLRERVEADEFPLTNGDRIRLTVSLGVSGFHPPGTHETADALLHAADAALYRAKTDGRNRVAVA
ncbi:MAG: diguanylate cyclase [Deltaproteobacteria bacterium]|nr:diguanylate cyclase [Deltaproteobacteria bacterium]